MPRQKKYTHTESKAEYTKTIQPISIIGDASFSPYMDLFQHKPENVSLNSLGTLFGFFKMNEANADNAHIVNFLASTIRKEYYSLVRRRPEDALEAALHRANIALSEIANQGNVSWIGRIEAAVAVLEKNTIHFATAGTAFVLLFRGGRLSNIAAEGDPNPSPLKTFTDITTGTVTAGDMITMTTSELTELFTLQELSRTMTQIPQEDFAQFVHTALINEFHLAGTIIIGIGDKEQPRRPIKEPRAANLSNVFSQDPFFKKEPPRRQSPSRGRKNSAEKKEERTTPNTGPIYIRQDETAGFHDRPGETKQRLLLYKERLTDSWDAFSISFSRQWRVTKKRFNEVGAHIASRAAEKTRRITAGRTPKGTPIETDTPKRDGETFLEKLSRAKKITPAAKNSAAQGDSSSLHSFLFGAAAATRKAARFIIPHFGKIRSLFLKMNYQQRVASFIAIAVIIFGPVALSRRQSPPPAPQTETTKSALPTSEETENTALEQEKNISFLEDGDIQRVPHSIADARTTLSLPDGRIAIVGSSQIGVFNESEIAEIVDIPQDFGTITAAAYMSALNLVFLYASDGNLFSWSPATGDIARGRITLPDGAKINALGAYLTYLYAFDGDRGAIYRYPRAESEGGFGEKVDWFKESWGEEFSDWAIGESIFIAQGDLVSRWFQGKKQNFSVGETFVPLRADRLWTAAGSDNLFILDAENGRVARVHKETGAVEKQYARADFASALSLTAANGKIFLLTDDSVTSFEEEN